MSRPQLTERARGLARSVARHVRRAMGTVCGKTTAVDIWIQDHHRLVVVSVLLVLGTGTGLLLHWWWVQVVDVARQLAPVLTIVSIIASALLSVLAWFRKRRRKRLAAQAAALAVAASQHNEG
ncbi:hypothetical protein [Streptomyces chartreusis]